MPNSNSELTQPQNILQNRLKYLVATLAISSLFIILWGIFARLSVNSKAVGFILPAFSVKTILSTSNGNVKALSPAQSAKINKILNSIDTARLKDSVSNLANQSEKSNTNLMTSIGSDSYPIAKAIPRLRAYLDNIEEILDITLSIESSSSSLATTLRANVENKSLQAEQNNRRSGSQRVTNSETCYRRGEPVYIQEDQLRETKLKQATSNALLKLSLFRSNYLPLQYIHQNQVKQNSFLQQLTSEAAQLAKSKAITKNKYLDVQSELLKSNSSLLSSLKDKQNLQVQVIEAFYSLFTTYVDYQDSAYVRADSDICVFERIIPDKANVDKSELLALAIPVGSSPKTTEYAQDALQPKDAAKQQSPYYNVVYDIPFFYLADTDRGIKINDFAVVYPSNVPRNTFGGIKGKVIDSGRVLANKSSIRWITGLTDISPFSSRNTNRQTMYYGVIRLQRGDSYTGYKWTSGKGPSYPILLGTAADIVIRVSTQSPISNILPTLRSITGLKE